jgi:hypothetical protein
MQQKDLLLVFDEPFAGVTDDFVPFIVGRLNEMRKRHNILLVTNDHVDTLKGLADNTIVVSAIDRSTVLVNQLQNVPRDKAILALSVGEEFQYHSTWTDWKFFFDVEVYNNGALLGIAVFTMVTCALFLATFWDSSSEQGGLIIVAASLIAFFCVNPYLLQLTDWRNFMLEESEALLHSSKATNSALKSFVALFLVLVISLLEWGIVNAVVNGFEDRKFWVAILMDSASMTLPLIYFGLYTLLPFQAVDILGSMPFLFMIFFSTTFSPGSGVPGLKGLRYLFSRFYFFCMIPVVKDSMEGCPNDDVLVLYMVLSAMVGLFLFIGMEIVKVLMKTFRTNKAAKKNNMLKDAEFEQLQIELYGEAVLLRNSLSGTNHSSRQK